MLPVEVWEIVGGHLGDFDYAALRLVAKGLPPRPFRLSEERAEAVFGIFAEFARIKCCSTCCGLRREDAADSESMAGHDHGRGRRGPADSPAVLGAIDRYCAPAMTARLAMLHGHHGYVARVWGAEAAGEAAASLDLTHLLSPPFTGRQMQAAADSLAGAAYRHMLAGGGAPVGVVPDSVVDAGDLDMAKLIVSGGGRFGCAGPSRAIRCDRLAMLVFMLALEMGEDELYEAMGHAIHLEKPDTVRMLMMLGVRPFHCHMQCANSVAMLDVLHDTTPWRQPF